MLLGTLSSAALGDFGLKMLIHELIEVSFILTYKVYTLIGNQVAIKLQSNCGLVLFVST